MQVVDFITVAFDARSEAECGEKCVVERGRVTWTYEVRRCGTEWSNRAEAETSEIKGQSYGAKGNKISESEVEQTKARKG